jgi:hypothetical protein
MRSSQISRNTCRLIIFCAAFCAVATLPLLSRAQPSTSVNIVNNSNRQIGQVYLAPVGSDDWSGNQLGESVIAAGQSYNLTNVACDQQQVRVIGEDQDGCFVSTVVSCGGNATWTITNDTARDCGGN